MKRDSQHNGSGDSSDWGEELAGRWSELVDEIKGESDRGAAIVVAARIEEGLEVLLKAKLTPSISSEDELFDIPYAPLQSLSAKIDLAYRIGVISPDVWASLHLLRKLRNDFAHSSGKLDFAAQQVQSHVRQLFKLNQEILDDMAGTVKDWSQQSEEARRLIGPWRHAGSSIGNLVERLGWRLVFDMFAAMVAAALMILPSRVVPIRPLKAPYKSSRGDG